MDSQLHNVNVVAKTDLPTPADVKAALPMDPLPTERPAVFDDEESPVMPVAELGLDAPVVEALASAGIDSTASLAAMTTQDLLEIRGIGRARAEQIRAAVIALGSG